MEKENTQNTAEIKLQSTAEFKAQNTGDMKAISDENDNFYESGTRREKIIAMIVCTIIAFIIWLIIANINMKAATPAPLPLELDADEVGVCTELLV